MCVFVALGIQHAMRMSRIVFSVACLALPCFSTSSHKQHFCVKTLLNTKCLFWFSVSDFSFKEELREMWSKIYGGCHAKYRIFLLTYLLTPPCRVLLEKLTGFQLVKKFPTFHGTRRFITALTSVRHLSLSWASPIQSIYPHPSS